MLSMSRLLTRESHAACGLGCKGLPVNTLGTDRCGFDSHHPLHFQPARANNSQCRACPQVHAHTGRRWPPFTRDTEARVRQGAPPRSAEVARMSTYGRSGHSVTVAQDFRKRTISSALRALEIGSESNAATLRLGWICQFTDRFKNVQDRSIVSLQLALEVC